MKMTTIEVGAIAGAHGIRGDVRVIPLSLTPDFFSRVHTFYLDGKAVIPTVSRVHQNTVLLKLPGIDDRDAALALRGKCLSVARAEVTLPAGEYFDAELLGLTVLDADSGAELGKLTEVSPYPAHKVYTVQGKREYLIPAVPEVFIASVDLDAGTMGVHLLEGLATDEN
ncbi:MAG: ribosome maturation factor RimM [Oscillospiraceae bacterium]